MWYLKKAAYILQLFGTAICFRPILLFIRLLSGSGEASWTDCAVIEKRTLLNGQPFCGDGSIAYQLRYRQSNLDVQNGGYTMARSHAESWLVVLC